MCLTLETKAAAYNRRPVDDSQAEDDVPSTLPKQSYGIPVNRVSKTRNTVQSESYMLRDTQQQRKPFGFVSSIIESEDALTAV